MSDSFAKDEIFSGLAEVGLALGNRHRLRILSLLSHGPKTVEQLVEAIEQSKAATGAHLKVLRMSGLVKAQKKGKYVWCELAGEPVEKLWLSLRESGEQILPGLQQKVEQWQTSDALLSDLSPLDLQARLSTKKIVLLDLRTPVEYSTGHIPFARNTPFEELDKHLGTLRTKLPILAYCRGPYCLKARKGTQKIAKLFPGVRRLKFSLPEWRHQGLAVEVSK